MGGRGYGGWSAEVVTAWVEASCAEQGLVVAITDPLTVGQVGVLLGVVVGRAGRSEVGGAASAASAPHTARPVSRPRAGLQPPHGLHPVGVQASGSRDPGGDDGVVQDSGDDRGLPGEVQGVPGGAQGLAVAG